MSIYMSKLFSRSNSSLLLQSNTALSASTIRLRKDMYILDSGITPPRLATPEELIRPPKTPTRFTTKVGYLNSTTTSHKTHVRPLLLQRIFVDMVTGDAKSALAAGARFEESVGPNEESGEKGVVLPKRFRKSRAWVELRDMWRSNTKVKGFVAEKVRGGWSVGVAGYLAFLPHRQNYSRRIVGDRFVVESWSHKNMVVAKAG